MVLGGARSKSGGVNQSNDTARVPGDTREPLRHPSNDRALRAPETPSPGLRFTALGLVVLTLIAVPWVLWGDGIESRVRALMAQPGATELFAASAGGLLAADVLLPVPSSFVAVASGVVLGVVWGSVVNFAGLMLGSIVGYVVGAKAGVLVARRMVGEKSWRRAEEWTARYGSSVVLALRAVPILAEASTFFAGATRMGWGRYLLYSGVANLGVAVVYAGVGDVSADTGHLEVALMAGCVLPALAMLAAGFVRRRQS